MSESTTPSVTESNMTGQGDTRQASITNNNSNARQRGNKYKNKKNEKAFKGNTRDMNGHVFEAYYECRDETQFKKTLDMIGMFRYYSQSVGHCFKHQSVGMIIPVGHIFRSNLELVVY